MTGAEPHVNVALAVVQRGDGRVPFAERPRGRISVGYRVLWLRTDRLLIEAPPDFAAGEAARHRLARAAGRGGADGNIGVTIP
ncbi:MAG: hypothetical protein ACYC7B_12600 [Burkholderiales bacterium]